MDLENNSLLNKKVRVSYITIPNEITRDEGIVFKIENNFIILKLYNDKLKWVPLRTIVRIEEI